MRFIQCLSFGLVLCFGPASHAGAGVEEADALEVLQILLALPVSRHDTALDSMKGRDALYARLHVQALEGDQEAIASWLALSFAARTTQDGGLGGAFISDLKPLWDKQEDFVNRQILRSPWLAPAVCHYVGRYFGWEGRNTEGRLAFVEEAKSRLADLPDGPKEQCLHLIETSGVVD